MYRLAYDEPTGHELARALNAKPAGSNCWTAKCPSHSDRRPSFSIGVSRDGRALFHCFAGCTQARCSVALGGWGAIGAAAGCRECSIGPFKSGKRAKMIARCCGGGM